MSQKEKVIIRKAPDYNPVLIQKIIKEGLEEFGLTAKACGRITIKPNVVMAHPKVTPSAYTRAEFLDGLISVLEEGQGEGGSKIVIAEKCGAAIPTFRMFRRAGYYRLKKKHKIKLQPIEEARKKTVPLKKGKIHKKITTALEIVDNDFLIYTPKLKTNSLTQGLTGATKLNIGILCDKERMWNHNYNLDEKIVDLLEVGYPDFIATDAIEISYGGNHLTQHGWNLGIVLMATNPVAHDVVCAHIFHQDPRNIRHIALAHERGYGPVDLNEIEVRGDISLHEVMEKTKGLQTGYIRVDKVDCNVKVLCGEPYCGGGCHGVLLDWLYMIKDRKQKLWKNMPPWTFVVGKYNGDVTADKLIILGACTEIQGKVKAKTIRKIRGCPPKHKDLVLWLFLKTGILNPLFRVDLIYDSYICLFYTWIKRFITGRI
jgi:uncharacterized protein (DUF362 family)